MVRLNYLPGKTCVNALYKILFLWAEHLQKIYNSEMSTN